MSDISFSPIQLEAYGLFNDPQVTQLLYGGGAGSGKTILLGLLIALRCRNYPGVKEGLARKELKRLKQTTLATLLYKVHPMLGIKPDDFKYNTLESFIEYRNGSMILLLDLASQPSDPDFDSFGSLELTDVFIDEGGEVDKKAVDVLASRTSRWMTKEHGIVGKLVMSCNPSQNFLRSEYYEPFMRLGGGSSQKWPIGEVWINDEKKTAYRAFVRSTVLDNPFIDKNYMENLKTLPDQERRRLLDGDWNYADGDNTLFKAAILDRATVYELPPQSERFDKFIGVDVSDLGGDKTVVTLCESGVITKQVTIDLQDAKVGEKPVSYILADELIKFAQQNGFTSNYARHIAIEGNGVGAAARDAMRVRGWFTAIYTATMNSRGESYYNFMLDMDAGRIRILNGIDDGTLRKQLAAHTYEMVDQKPRVAKKERIKQLLGGASPDFADSANICNWIRAGGAGRYDPKKAQSRVRF